MKQAIILAAGEGSRLRPFTVSRPKVMLTSGGKSILQSVIEVLAACNIRDIIIVVGYQREQIYDSLGSGDEFGISIRYVTQDRQLGTAHALKQAEALTDEEFLVLPGDHLIEVETIRDFVSQTPWALLLKRVPDNQTVRYGVVATEDGMVQAIIEKPKEPCDAPVSTGIFSLRREIFDAIGTESDMPSVINRMTGGGFRFKAVETGGLWLDAVYPWDLLMLNDHSLLSIQPSLEGTIEKGVTVKGHVAVGKGSVIRSGSYITGPVIIGRGCTIGPAVVAGAGVSIGDNVTIGPFSVVKNCIIGDDVAIEARVSLQDSVIGCGCHISAGFCALSGAADVSVADEFHHINVGVMMGQNCDIGSGVVAQAGTIVGNSSRVNPLKVISGYINDGSQVV